MPKIKITEEDRLFSLYIRERDKWICQRCKKQHDRKNGLQCSHYFGRGKWSTRFDPENCIALCFGCHQYWGSVNKEEYRRFMIEKLGEDGLARLELKSNQRFNRGKWNREDKYRFRVEIKDKTLEVRRH